jgi:hypothetical protein
VREIKIEFVLKSEKTFYCEINFKCQITFNSGMEGVVVY